MRMVKKKTVVECSDCNLEMEYVFSSPIIRGMKTLTSGLIEKNSIKRIYQCPKCKKIDALFEELRWSSGGYKGVIL